MGERRLNGLEGRCRVGRIRRISGLEGSVGEGEEVKRFREERRVKGIEERIG